MSQNNEQQQRSSTPGPIVRESTAVDDTTVPEDNAGQSTVNEQAQLEHQSSRPILVRASSTARPPPEPTTTSNGITNSQIQSEKHPSAWDANEVREWFQAYKLDQLYQTLFVLPNPMNGQDLAGIFESKLKNYDSYRNRYTTRLTNCDLNLFKDFDRFGQLLDTYFTDKYVHRFDIAFSFPGDRRETVSQIAEYLCRKMNTKTNEELGQQRIFYDKYHEVELARPNLDTYLQAIYRYNARLIVVFMCAEYTRREWCGLESRSIRGLIQAGQGDRIMLLSFDGCLIDGILSIDGYINIANMSVDIVAQKIYERLQMLDTPLQATHRLSEPSVRPRAIDLQTVRTDTIQLMTFLPWAVLIAIFAYFLGAYRGN